MSVVGSIISVNETDLEGFKAIPNGNPKYGNQKLYLDSFFWDLNYVLTQFLDTIDAENTIIIYGAHVVSNDETHFAYSTNIENIEILNRLNKISEEDFERGLNRAFEDKRSMIKHNRPEEVYKKGMIEYFNQLKSFYSNAVKDSQSTIYIYG